MAIFNQSALKSFINYIKRLLEHTLLTAISMIIISIVVIIYSIPSNGLNIWEIYRLNKFQFEYVGGYDLLEPYFLIQDVKIDDNNNRLTFTGRITNIDQGPWLHPRPYAIFYVDNIRMGNCFSYSIHSIYAKIELVGPNES
ncbi:MAG: hypothetical protein GTO02_13790, partial [Candidatus Dadabacteria bacterium]|nr:hypothetical protein [Candidatus Dadabacteria bacterium]